MTITPEQVHGTPRWQTPGPQPNGLQATPEGLWVIDQEDLNVYLLDWQTGGATKHFPTATYHSSGITWDGENVWVSSTFTPIEIFQYSAEGKELKRLGTPGASEKSGAHGLEWIDGKLWVTVPPSATTYQLDPENGKILRQFPAPGNRPHGLAWDGETLWVAETTDRTITGYDLEGNVRRILALDEGPADAPAPHGLTYHQGELWYCDAETRFVATITL
jgi:DNA-binding beta-propeller fold protein YncE